jgi:hemoglobin/transferrin/lactoferrin receptor protein
MILCAASPVLGQTIRVLDAMGDPVHEVQVIVFSSSSFQIYHTSTEGLVVVDANKGMDSVVFEHPSYASLSQTAQQLKKNRYNVELEMHSHLKTAYVSRHNPDYKKQKDQVIKMVSVSPKEVRFHNPQTTADLIGLSNQVYIQKSQMGGGSPMIRGFAANNVLIVVDGVRMNNAIFRDGNLQNIISIDPHIIGRTEVLFGPGSMIYGSDAMGGVMAFKTRQPKQSDTQFYSGNVMLRTATANRETSWHVDLDYGKGRFSGLSSITLSNYGDLVMGNNGPVEYTRPVFSEFNGNTDSIIQSDEPNKQYFTGYSQVNFNQKFRFSPDSFTNLVTHFGYATTSPIPRYDRLVQTQNGLPRFGDWYYGPQKWTQANQRLERKLPKAFFANKMVAIAAFQRFEESRFVRRFKSDNLNHNTEVVNVGSLNIDFDKELGKTDILYGAELVTNRVQSIGVGTQIDSGFTYDIATRYPDSSSMNTYAGYLSFKRDLDSSWMLSIGGRYTFIALDAPFNTSFYDFPFTNISIRKSALSGSLGLRYLFGEKSYVFANVASGFRAPNIDDMGKIFDSQPDRVIVPNPQLQPEYSYNSELGIHLTVGQRVEVLLNAYYTIIDNVIIRSDYTLNGQDSLSYNGEMLRIQSLVNSDQGTIRGLEAQFRYDFTNELSVRTGFNVMTGSTAEGLPIRHVAPNFGNTSINWSRNKLRLSLYSNYNMELSNDKLALSEQAKTHIYAFDANGLPYSPAWWTLNLKSKISFSNSLILNLGLENILNKRYRPYSSGISAPGRNLILSIYGRF